MPPLFEFKSICVVCGKQMKTVKGIEKPETAIEAVEQLQEFFEADMWHACSNEWIDEQDMLEYLKMHFEVCLKQIKELNNEIKS